MLQTSPVVVHQPYKGIQDLLKVLLISAVAVLKVSAGVPVPVPVIDFCCIRHSARVLASKENVFLSKKRKQDVCFRCKKTHIFDSGLLSLGRCSKIKLTAKIY